MKKFRLNVISSFILVMIGAGLVLAQGSRPKGLLVGSVLDKASGEPLPGANVILENTVLGTAAGLDGEFMLKNIPFGTYNVRATMIGYEPQVIQNIAVTSVDKLRVNFELRESAIMTKEVVVTASKRTQEISDSPASVAVVSARDFVMKNEIYLDRLLEYAPGVNFMGSQVNIRGSSGFSYGAGSRVMFLVDGVPVMPGDSGDIKWDIVPATQIERIEIVKGAGSALYGSSALGGVINVITKSAAVKPQTNVRFSAGIYDKPRFEEWRWTDRTLHYDDFDLDHSQRFGNVNLFLSAGRHQSTGYRQTGHYQRLNFAGKVAAQLSATQNITVSANHEFGDRGSGVQWLSQRQPLMVPPESVSDKVNSGKMGINAFHRWAVNKQLGLKTRVSYFRNRWENFFFDNNDHSVAQRYGFELQGDYLLNGKHALTFGTDEALDNVRSNFFESHDAYTLSAYAQDEFKVLPNLSLTVGMRYDYYRIDTGITDSEWSPKAGLVWHASHLSTVRSSVGRGFRAPSMAERFSEGIVSGFRVVQNPTLRAETAWSYELGFNQILSDFLVFDIAGFYNNFWDLIEPEPDANQVITFINVTRACIQGAEVNLKGSFWRKHLNANLSYTFMDPRDLDTDEILAYRSRHVAMASMSFNYGIFELGADYRFIDRIENVKVYPLDDRVSQKVLDVQITANWTPWRFSIDVDNALNYNYTQVERTLLPIRRYVATVMLTL